MASFPRVLQFAPVHSSVEPAFWNELGSRKLHVFRLDDAARNIVGFYSASSHASIASPLTLRLESFSESPSGDSSGLYFQVPGQLYNSNSVEEFKKLDKNTILNRAGEMIADSIASGDALSDPSLLFRFVLLSFADLKHHRFYNWFGFPAVVMSEAGGQFKELCAPVTAQAYFSEAQNLAIFNGFDGMKSSNRPGYFLVKKKDDTCEVARFQELKTFYEAGEEVIVAFADPHNSAHHAGWPLRNLLALLHAALPETKDVTILCYREVGGRRDNLSIVLRVSFPDLGSPFATADWKEAASKQGFRTVGWEMNAKGRPGARVADLGSSIDPKQLASSSVDLNLALMKWRLLPELDVERISSSRCLLLGAGTLGCVVARTLMAWGVKNITFVDNGKVSFSNPVRQSLFEFEDCLNGGKPKAEAAAERLKAIFPGMNAKGHCLSVPMPGHPVAKGKDEEATIDALKQLEGLVDAHDVVFLLTDSRESRWLPTMMCASRGKLLLNTALGFDSYVVMRHGVPRGSEAFAESSGASSETRLGCYFCNDIVAPADSLSNRSLDQQCTVTRPGLANVAGSMTVELFASTVQHPQGKFAPACETGSVLGAVPHQMRGFLGTFSTLSIKGVAFDKCTACSQPVIDAYRTSGHDFILEVLNNGAEHLEALTGLDAMKAATDDIEMEWNSEEDDF